MSGTDAGIGTGEVTEFEGPTMDSGTEGLDTWYWMLSLILNLCAGMYVIISRECLY